MKYIFLTLLIANSAIANSLDLKVNELNKSLNPKEIGNIGYTVDYKQEKSFVWININKVKKICEHVNVTILKNNKLITKTEFLCHNKWVLEKGTTLFQIQCENEINYCLKTLTKEVSVEVIHEMITNNISEVNVK